MKRRLSDTFACALYASTSLKLMQMKMKANEAS